MTDQIQDQDVELDEIDAEDISEAHDPKNAEQQSVQSVKSAEGAGKGQAAARKGDKRNSEPMPKTKAGMLNAIYSTLASQTKTDVAAAYKNMFGEEAVIEAEAMAEALDVESELNDLVESEATLSEEFKEKTAILFDAALKSRLSEEVERLEANYKEELSEELNTLKESMVEKIDSYLNYVVENWMEENKLSIQNGLRTEIAENFMNNLKTLFTESYIAVPDSKVDLVDDLAGQVEELEEKLNSTTKNAIALSEEIEDLKRERVIAEAAKGLADTQAEKLAELCEKVDFDNEASFAKKVATIKESFFAESKTEAALIEDAETSEEDIVEVSESMAVYVNALRKTK